MPVGRGKSYKDLTDGDKDRIVNLFVNDKVKARDIAKMIPTTNRAIPIVLRERNIASKRKNRYTLDEHYFDAIDTERKAYYLGLIGADGCITNVNYFALSLTDKELVESLSNDLNYTGEVYRPFSKDTNKQNQYRINFSSKILCDALRKHGIHEKKSLTYDNLPNLDNTLMPHYLRGYFDGDGCMYRYTSSSTVKGKVYTYERYTFDIIATEKMCINIQCLLRDELNIDSYIHDSKCPTMKYICVYKEKSLVDLFGYLYTNSSICLQRKRNKWNSFMSARKLPKIVLE